MPKKVNRVINGYMYDGTDAGFTYKVYLPRNPIFTKKHRPPKDLLVTSQIADSRWNMFQYCFYLHVNDNDDICFDYDNKRFDDPTSLYHVLEMYVAKQKQLTREQLRIIEIAGMITPTGQITLKMPNCFVESLLPEKDSEVSVGLAMDKFLQKITDDELNELSNSILRKMSAEQETLPSGNRPIIGIPLSQDKDDNKKVLQEFVKKNRKYMLGGQTAKSKHVYLYEKNKPVKGKPHWKGVIILRSLSGTYYIINLNRPASLKASEGLNTLSKRSNRDYPDLEYNITMSQAVHDWLERNKLIDLVDTDRIPNDFNKIEIDSSKVSDVDSIFP